MKIIDILNKMANGTLEDEFEFKYDNDTYEYNKKENKLVSEEYGTRLGGYYIVENILNNEVEVIEAKKKIEEIGTSKTIEEKQGGLKILEELIHICEGKINELVRAVNKLNKEREEK